MSLNDLYTMHAAMQRYGGSFVESFSNCLARADSRNTARLLAAFPDLVAEYGPGSKAFDVLRSEETA